MSNLFTFLFLICRFFLLLFIIFFIIEDTLSSQFLFCLLLNSCSVDDIDEIDNKEENDADCPFDSDSDESLVFDDIDLTQWLELLVLSDEVVCEVDTATLEDLDTRLDWDDFVCEVDCFSWLDDVDKEC